MLQKQLRHLAEAVLFIIFTMRSDPATPNIKLVDSLSTLHELLENLRLIPKSSPPFFVDLEGINLGRSGSISILSLYAVHKGITYLVDVYKLGKAAFSSPQPGQNTSLQGIMESPTIKKVMFDVRNESDALFSHYNIHLDGIQDLQLMELATRSGSKKYVADKSQKGGMEKTQGREIRDYCAGDVSQLPGLYNTYERKMSPTWRTKVQNATNGRIRLSQKPEYDGQASDKVLGPWTEDCSKDWHALFDEWEDNDFLDNLRYDEQFDNMAYDGWDDYPDTARDCIGWEEDMIKNGSPL
ncbi:hypothetical protein I7I51_00511 [Histoplasma capsulatum]|uniref:3'-5' exonuclease domain-containing protein n=1 Tax=Ajellomyces capsulatus TaxID=5037 RepID=A0A8A1MFK7_AJECA|nr:hypothetical protein I7I51_00511 [Histoplasma capsulatum]